MARPEPAQTAPVSTGLAREDAIAERLVADEIAAHPIDPDTLAQALAAEGLTIEEVPLDPELLMGPTSLADGLAAADAAAAGVPVADEEPQAESPLSESEQERFLRGPEDPNRGIPPEEREHLDDWDDQTANEQENLPDYEQQG